MALTQLDKTYSDLETEVALALGWERDSSKWKADRVTDFRLILDAGLNQVYFPPVLPGESVSYDWSFLWPYAQLQLYPSVKSGTPITHTNASKVPHVTFSSNWTTLTDDDAVGRSVWIEFEGGGKATRKVTRLLADGKTLRLERPIWTTAELANTVIEAISRRHYYDLPDDFGGIHSDGFTFRRDEEKWRGRKITRVSEAEIRLMDTDITANYPPEFFAIVSTFDSDVDSPFSLEQLSRQKWQVIFGPGLVEETVQLEYRYQVQPPSLDSSTVTYPYGGAMLAETIVASVIDKAFQRTAQDDSKHGRFMVSLQHSITRDRNNFLEQNQGRSAWQDQPRIFASNELLAT